MNTSKIILPQEGDLIVRPQNVPTPRKESPTALSHTKLLMKDRAEIRRFVRLIRKIIKRKHSGVEIEVAHLADQSCCYRQRWPQTYEELMRDLQDKFEVPHGE